MKNFLLYSIIVFFCNSTLHAEPDIVDLKDTSSILNAEYQDLSPAYGCLWYKEPILYNMYRLRLLENDPVNALVKRLFFLNNDMINFNPQHNQQRLETHLTPEIISSIVGYIWQSKNINVNQKDIGTEVEKIYEKTQGKTSKENIRAGVIAKKRTAAITDFSRNITKLLNNNKTLNQAFKAGLEKSIAEMELKTGNPNDETESPSDLQETIDKLKQRISPGQWDKSYKGFVEAFAKSVTDVLQICDNQTYLDNTLTNILLGFVWAKSFTKKDLLTYFKGLHSVLGDDAFSNLSFNNNDTEQSWLNANFSHDDYVAFKANFNKNPIDFMKNTEQAIFYYYGFRKYEAKFPEKINYLNAVRYKDKSFSNCGETLLLNMFNMLAYDANLGLFSVDRLKKIGVIDQNLLNFYKEYSNPTSHQFLETHNAFASIVSDLPGVVYKHADPTYEITAQGNGEKGFENFNNIIKHFTGQPSLQKLFEKATLELMLNASFSEPVINKVVKSVFIDMTIGTYKFKWKFTQNHFDLEAPKIAQLWPSASTLPLLKDTHLSYFCLYGGLIDPSSRAQFYHYCVCKKLQDVYLTVNLLRLLVTSNNYNNYSTFVKDLYNFFPSQDVFAQNLFFNQFSDTVFSEFITNNMIQSTLSDTQKAGIITNIIGRNLTGKFTEYINAMAKTIHEDSVKAAIIRALIERGLIDTFPEYINANLPTIKEEQLNASLIGLIMTKGITNKFSEYIQLKLPTIKEIALNASIIKTMLQTDMADQYYDHINSMLPKIKDEFDIREIVQKIIEKNLAVKFKSAIDSMLPLLRNEAGNRYVIISLMLNNNLADLFADYINTSLPAITARWEISSLLGKIFQKSLIDKFPNGIGAILPRVELDVEKVGYIKTIIDSGLAEKFDSSIKTTLSTIQDESEKRNLVVFFIDKNLDDHFNDFVTKSLATITDDHDRIMIINTILDKKLTKKFAEYISSTLPRIQNDRAKNQLLTDIINKGLAEELSGAIYATLPTFKQPPQSVVGLLIQKKLYEKFKEPIDAAIDSMIPSIADRYRNTITAQ